MKYKGFLLATAGGVASMSGAQAADLPVKARMMAPAPVATWDGFYIGVHAGAAWQTADAAYADPADGAGQKATGTSFIGGGQIGYNWQIAPTWVVGLEADISGLTGKATAGAMFDTTKGNAVEAKINWLSTFRGRVGWIANGDTMLYATGGLAVGGVKNTWAPNGLASSSDPANTTKSVSKTKTGWAAGAGIEHMLTRNWTFGLEALYVDLGKTTSPLTASGKSSTFKNTAAIARLKLNYKF